MVCLAIALAQVTVGPQLGKLKSSEGGVDVDGTREALIYELMSETLDQERRDFLGTVMTKEAMVANHTVNGVLLTRPIPRFGIHQGFKFTSVSPGRPCHENMVHRRRSQSGRKCGHPFDQVIGNAYL